MSTPQECKGCKYLNWDCKNCFLEFENNGRLNVTLFFIMTRQCNYRCSYCAIDFSDDALSFETIDKYIQLIENDRSKINELRIEFFGGEPLLEFEKIQYIVEHTSKLNIANYSIVTNGEFLTKEKISFFNLHNFDIIFSVSLHSFYILKRQDIFNTNLKNFLVNFIIEPGKERFMYEIFKKLITIGFRNFSIIAIRYTQKRSQKHLDNLDNLLGKIQVLNSGLLSRGINLGLFTGKNNDDLERGLGKNDFEIIMDYDGKMYADYELELYILRDFVPKNIFNIQDILLGDIYKQLPINIDQLLEKRNTIKPNFYLNNIADYLQMDESDTELGKVMSKYNINK